jgi:hypothetical protein
MQSALFPGVVVAVVAAVLLYRKLDQRRVGRLKVSGGRKSLVLNLRNTRT